MKKVTIFTLKKKKYYKNKKIYSLYLIINIKVRNNQWQETYLFIGVGLIMEFIKTFLMKKLN